MKPFIRIKKGIFRGKKINLPPPSKIGITNVTPSLIKEALFQILENYRQAEVEAFAFFDLCAGSGQMAVEALSQGYSPVHLVELDSKRFSYILRRVASGLPGLILHHKDFRRMAPIILKYNKTILFLDPPYSFWSHNGCPPIDTLVDALLLKSESFISMNSESKKVTGSKDGNDSIPEKRMIITIQGPQPYERSIQENGKKNRQILDEKREIRCYRNHYISILDLIM